MDILKENIFIVGPQATGISFIGREDDIKDIETSIFGGVGAVHLVGPTRIGKSSLINQVFEKNRNRPKRICVQVSMGECLDAYDFWKTLITKIQEQLKDVDLWNGNFERTFGQFNSNIYIASCNWFIDFKGPFKNILIQLSKIGYRLVLSIDEFDSVERIFGQEPYHFQLLRSIYYSPEYVTSGVIISRRRLHLLEAKCKDISTFHGVFREKTLYAFNDKDMKFFYDALDFCDIKLSTGGKQKFEQYTGRMPYLCCMFAERMVTHYSEKGIVSDKEVTSIFKECLPQVDRYYEDLIDRLEYDNHIEIVFYLSISSKLPNYITGRDIQHLTTMGILIPEQKNGIVEYYAYSKDFMTYFRLRPLKLPAWETMMQSEKKIKAIFKKEYPKLDKVTYDDLLSDNSNSIMQNLNLEYSELKINLGKIKRYCEDLSIHKEHPTILDVLTLSEVVKNILNAWSNRFHKYFNGDDSWKTKLEYIKEIRNPMAHAAIEYIDPEELSICMKYCDEIIHININ